MIYVPIFRKYLLIIVLKAINKDQITKDKGFRKFQLQ